MNRPHPPAALPTSRARRGTGTVHEREETTMFVRGAIIGATVVLMAAIAPAALAMSQREGVQPKNPYFAPPPLNSIDHFKCYDVAEPPPIAPGIPARVGLRDQFGRQKAQVGELVMLCSAVRKLHGDVVSRVNQPELHLACF